MSPDDPVLNALADQPVDAGFLARLASQLRDARRWSELLDVRLMEIRLANGLPVDAPSLADALPNVRRRIEADYADACEEAGRGLLADRRWNDAWYYLNAAGLSQPMREALAEVTPDEESAEELIGIALHEGADPPRGYRWLIDHFGTCNAVSTLEGIGPHLSVADLTACAAVLVDRLYEEVVEGVRGHVERHEGSPADEAPLAEILDGRDWLFEHEMAHVDASHLQAAVRMARVVADRQRVERAAQLAAYGERLHPSLHYADAPPFDDVYKAHRQFFAAQLGEAVDEAVAYFRSRAEQANVALDGLAALETLMVLLARLDRPGDALREFGRLAPVETSLSPYAPRPIDLARESGEWDLFDEVMRARGDVVSVAQGKVVRSAGG